MILIVAAQAASVCHGCSAHACFVGSHGAAACFRGRHWLGRGARKKEVLCTTTSMAAEEQAVKQCNMLAVPAEQSCWFLRVPSSMSICFG
jgi:hypothetical protein